MLFKEAIFILNNIQNIDFETASINIHMLIKTTRIFRLNKLKWAHGKSNFTDRHSYINQVKSQRRISTTVLITEGEKRDKREENGSDWCGSVD